MLSVLMTIRRRLRAKITRLPLLLMTGHLRVFRVRTFGKLTADESFGFIILPKPFCQKASSQTTDECLIRQQTIR